MLIFDYLRAALLITVTGICAVTDLSFRLIPNRVIIPGMISAVIFGILSDADPEIKPLFYCISFILLLFFLFIFKLGGGGDVKLYAFLTLLYPNSTALYMIIISMVTAGICAFIMLGFKLITKEKRKYTLPLAFFVFLAAVITLITMEGDLWRG